jgi:hypothetical protein
MKNHLIIMTDFWLIQLTQTRTRLGYLWAIVAIGPWPRQIFVVSSLAPEHVIKRGNFSSWSGYRSIDAHWSDTFVRTKPHAPGSSDRLHATFNLLRIFIRWFTGFMMCSIHIDESLIHRSAAARPPHLCVFLSKKFDSLLACLDNRHTMHDF